MVVDPAGATTWSRTPADRGPPTRGWEKEHGQVSATPGAERARTVPTTARHLVRIGAVLTLAVLVLGSVRFARFDWFPVQLDRAPVTAERQVSPECLELIRPYVTESGRTISPVVVDEQQYLSLVQYYRGIPPGDLQVTCLYDPFTNRSGMSWIAHWLPFEEGIALGVVNTSMLLAALWLVLLAIRAQGAPPASVALGGALFAISWNTFFFGTALLVDSGVVALVALGWWLLVTGRPWWLVPILALGYPIKETVGILLPVMAAWAWREVCTGRRSIPAAWAPTVLSALAFVAGVVVWRGTLPTPAAAWEVTPDLGDMVANLTDVVSLGSFVVGAGPLVLLSFLRWRQLAASEGVVRAAVDPAVVGVLIALGICAWSFITVDLTPRLFWIGYPFAASLAAAWSSEGRPAEWLGSLQARFR
jgi:hypothetical protein